MRFDSFSTGILFLVVFTAIIGAAFYFLFKKSSFLKFTSPSNKSSTSYKLSKPVLWSLLLILLVVLFWMDFARDYTFKNLNWQMTYLYAIENGGVGLYNYTDSFMERILGSASSETVYYLKYVMTLTFSLVYFTLTTLILKLIFNNQRIVPFTFLFYALSFCLMSLVFVLALFPF